MVGRNKGNRMKPQAPHFRGATTIRLLRMSNDRHNSQELIHTRALKHGTKK